jgi:hypothetical protein
MSLREDFEQALALHFTHLLKLAAEQRGGVHILLNELFYAHADHDPLDEVKENLVYRKRLIEIELSTPTVEVTLQTVALNSDLKPRWIFGLMFNENEDSVAWEWRIDSVAVTIEPDNSYGIEYYRFSPKNFWPDDFPKDHPVWLRYSELIALDTVAKGIDPQL